MKKQAAQKIVIIGCGNVAWHIAKHLRSTLKAEVFVYNHKENTKLLPFKTILKCKVAVGLDKIINDAAAYFICVTDKYISGVANALEIRNPNALLVHTSGSAKLQDLGDRIHSTAVFYPLQTFSREASIDWKEVPILIETGNKNSEKTVLRLAGQFSHTVLKLDHKQRLKFHLAAVLVNNFTNALYVSAFDLLETDNKKLDFKLLLPLINQTTAKLRTLKPRDAQTGPAKRKDEQVMKKHLALIPKESHLRKIYKQLSKLIASQQHA